MYCGFWFSLQYTKIKRIMYEIFYLLRKPQSGSERKETLKGKLNKT